MSVTINKPLVLSAYTGLAEMVIMRILSKKKSDEITVTASDTGWKVVNLTIVRSLSA
jgi:hypothetical protein